MKRIALLIGLFALVGLAACGSEETTPDPAPTPAPATPEPAAEAEPAAAAPAAAANGAATGACARAHDCCMAAVAAMEAAMPDTPQTGMREQCADIQRRVAAGDAEEDWCGRQNEGARFSFGDLGATVPAVCQ